MQCVESQQTSHDGGLSREHEHGLPSCYLDCREENWCSCNGRLRPDLYLHWLIPSNIEISLSVTVCVGRLQRTRTAAERWAGHCWQRRRRSRTSAGALAGLKGETPLSQDLVPNFRTANHKTEAKTSDTFLQPTFHPTHVTSSVAVTKDTSGNVGDRVLSPCLQVQCSHASLQHKILHV